MALAESLIEPVSSQVVQILCTMSAKDFFRDFSPPISGLTPFHCILKCSLLREISDPPHLSQASILNPTGDLITGPELIKPFYPSLVVVSKAIWAAADPKSKSKSTPSSRPFCSFLSLNTATVQCYRTIMCCYSHYTITQHLYFCFLVLTHVACLQNKYLFVIQGVSKKRC